MNEYEKLGAFYLGKEYDMASRKRRDDLVLYDSKDLTTHGVIIGMTGSGKTGLGIALLEEALIDNIPIIAIDPKGDLTNLVLNFPQLRAQDTSSPLARNSSRVPLRASMNLKFSDGSTYSRPSCESTMPKSIEIRRRSMGRPCHWP